nr:serine hydrolase [Clostridia bacterium]
RNERIQNQPQYDPRYAQMPNQGQYMQNGYVQTNQPYPNMQGQMPNGAPMNSGRPVPQRNVPPSDVYARRRTPQIPPNRMQTASARNMQNMNTAQPNTGKTPKKIKLKLPDIKLPEFRTKRKLRSRSLFGNEDNPLKISKWINMDSRHSSLGALIALIVLFCGVVTAVSVGAHRNFERVVIEVAPSFEIEYSKLLRDAPSDTTDKVDMSGYSETLDAEIYSQTALLVDLSTGVILAEKNPDAKIYPASLTKIMTALIAVERLTDLDEKYMFTDEIFISLRGKNASISGFEAWETVTVRDLIYGVMLPSGAESSIAVAELIAGSETGFAAVMNEKAQEIGMESTHFVNCTGLHDDDHYTTASDLAKLLDYALSNDLFREIFTSKTYTTTRTKYHQTGLTFEQTVFRYIRAQGESRNNKYIIGGKTGFTIEGGQCLATLASDGNFEYILITTGAGEGTNRPYYNVLDAIYIYDRYLKDEIY